MRRVIAVYYLGDQPVASFVGDGETFERNREAESLPWRLMNDTRWGAIENYRAAPRLSEFDAWLEENPLNALVDQPLRPKGV